MKKVIEKIKQFFCRHDYKIIPNAEMEKLWGESINQLLRGEIYSFSQSREHGCSKCGKKTILGSGLIT